MENIRLKYIDIDEFEEDVYLHYVEIFPDNERKPLKLIKASYEKGYTKLIKIISNDKFVGFMMIIRVKNGEYTLLDYFAILPEYRNSKLGTKAIEILLEEEKECRGILAEIEKTGLGANEEENVYREKRKRFYERTNFRKLDFEILLYGVLYTPYLFSKLNDDDEKIIEEILKIYEEISGKEKIKQNCKIIK